jgi:hypothetical protein
MTQGGVYMCYEVAVCDRVTFCAVVMSKPGTRTPIHRPAGWAAVWRCGGAGTSLHEKSPNVAGAIIASSSAPCAQVPTITRPVGVQRILPAMVCVQVELSRWMERAQVMFTGFHVPLMAHGKDRGSCEAGKEAPDSSVSTWRCV